jgi:RNA polymerase sigma factor for flagellar operon FliA
MNEEHSLLWERLIRERDKEARDQLILSYVYLVKYIAGRLAIFFQGYYEQEDLISAGIPGLIDAIDRYNPDRGAKFETFATIKIRGAILDWVRSFSWAPRSVYSEARRVDEAIAQLEQELGRTPDDAEVAACLGLSAEQYSHLLERIAPVTLLALDDIRLQKNGAYEPDDPHRDTEAVVEKLALEEMKQDLAAGISRLPEKEQLVISLYYYSGLTLKEIGKVLGVTESRVSQLHTKAVLRLRQYFTRNPALSEAGFRKPDARKKN